MSGSCLPHEAEVFLARLSTIRGGNDTHLLYYVTHDRLLVDTTYLADSTGFDVPGFDTWFYGEPHDYTPGLRGNPLLRQLIVSRPFTWPSGYTVELAPRRNWRTYGLSGSTKQLVPQHWRPTRQYVEQLTGTHRESFLGKHIHPQGAEFVAKCFQLLGRRDLDYTLINGRVYVRPSHDSEAVSFEQMLIVAQALGLHAENVSKFTPILFNAIVHESSGLLAVRSDQMVVYDLDDCSGYGANCKRWHRYSFAECRAYDALCMAASIAEDPPVLGPVDVDLDDYNPTNVKENDMLPDPIPTLDDIAKATNESASWAAESAANKLRNGLKADGQDIARNAVSLAAEDMNSYASRFGFVFCVIGLIIGAMGVNIAKTQLWPNPYIQLLQQLTDEGYGRTDSETGEFELYPKDEFLVQHFDEMEEQAFKRSRQLARVQAGVQSHSRNQHEVAIPVSRPALGGDGDIVMASVQEMALVDKVQTALAWYANHDPQASAVKWLSKHQDIGTVYKLPPAEVETFMLNLDVDIALMDADDKLTKHLLANVDASRHFERLELARIHVRHMWNSHRDGANNAMVRCRVIAKEEHEKFEEKYYVKAEALAAED